MNNGARKGWRSKADGPPEWSPTSDLGHEHIAFVANGADQLAAMTPVVEFAAQATDLHVDSAVVGIGVGTTGQIEELIAGQDTLGGAPPESGASENSPPERLTTTPSGDRNSRRTRSSRHPANSH